jgi:hypothetical protein
LSRVTLKSMTEKQEAARVLACPFCGGTMKLAVIPLGVRELPSLRAFECLSCKELMTVEDED